MVYLKVKDWKVQTELKNEIEKKIIIKIRNERRVYYVIA